jgi:hypothetical protein
LGEYIIKACPVSDYADPPKTITVGDKEIEIDPWMIVIRSSSPKKEGVLGYWNTMRFYNGDYYLKIEVYDEQGRLVAEEIKTKTLVYDEGNRTKDVFIEYPIIGKSKGQTYHYEERPDITVNWPGSFPFEFKRTYNDNLKNQIFPLFFGWTHNHNIRIFENCTTDWKKDAYDKPVMDGNGIGVGKLWLCMPLGGQMYHGIVIPDDPNKVKYIPIDMKHLDLDKHRDYIIREVTAVDDTEPNAVIDLRYTHYAPNGMKMIFDKSGIELPYDFPETEGVVDWMVYIGIKCQRDRFGNKLMFLWNNQYEGREDEQFIYIKEISNNRTPAKLFFETSTSGPELYTKLQMKSGTKAVDIMDYGMHYGREYKGVVYLNYGYSKYNDEGQASTYMESYTSFLWRYQTNDNNQLVVQSVSAPSVKHMRASLKHPAEIGIEY